MKTKVTQNLLISDVTITSKPKFVTVLGNLSEKLSCAVLLKRKYFRVKIL